MGVLGVENKVVWKATIVFRGGSGTLIFHKDEAGRKEGAARARIAGITPPDALSKTVSVYWGGDPPEVDRSRVAECFK